MKKIFLFFVFILISNISYSADTKTTSLDAITDVNTADVIYIVDDVSGTATSKKATVSDLFGSAGDLDDGGTITANAVGTSEINLSIAPAWTGDHNFGSGGIEIENSTSLPGSCTVGQLFLDTNETAGQQLFGCEGGSFVLQGDGTGGSTVWSSIGNPTTTQTISFSDGEITTFDGANENEIFFTYSNSVADLTADLTMIKITVVDNDDTNYIPLSIHDDSDGTEDTLFLIDSLGAVTTGLWSAGAVDTTVANITTGGQFIVDVDGTAPGAAGSITVGLGSDGGLYHDGTNTVLENTTGDLRIFTDGTGAGIEIDSEDDTISFLYSGAAGADLATDGMNVVTGDSYQVNNTSVLNATTLGTGVLTSSLTTVGALNSGSIATGFGAIDNGTSNVTTGGILKVDVDGTAENAAGSFTLGAGNDMGLFFDGTDGVLITNGAGASGIKLDAEDDTLEFLGSGVLQLTMDLDGIDLITGNDYQINNTSVLNATTLGSGVTASSLTSVGTISSGTWEGTTVAVDQGGTGATSLTDGGILLGSGTGAITALGVATNGQIPIGDGATDPVLATITGDDAITITNGAGTIEIDVTPLASGSNGDSLNSQSDSGLEIVSNELTMLRGCSDNEILKWDETQDDWNCEADGGGGGGSGFVILDPQTAKITGTFILDGTMQIDAGEGSWRLLADDSTTEYAMWQFHVPSTYSSDPVFDVTVKAVAVSGSFDIEMDVMCASAGESIVTASFDTVNEVGIGSVPNGTRGSTTTISIPLLNNDSMAAEDLCFFRESRDHDDSNDVMVGDLEILGGLIRWTE